MNLKQAILLRTRIATFAILVFASMVLFQAFQLTVVKREEYIKISEEQSLRMREIKAIRGNILSWDGRLLATSLPKYEIRFDTRASGITDELFYKQVDSLAILCAIYFPDKNYALWKSYFVNARKRNDRYLLIRQNVSFEIAKAMNQWPIFRMGKYAGGLIREERNVREMPFGKMARRTIGFQAVNGNSVGLENAFDSLLRGVSGKRLEQKVSSNVWRPVGQSEFRPDNGCDIVTTLDINIQDVAEDALKKALSESNSQSGCAVLMEVETGAIRAIANFSRGSDGQYYEDINLAIGIASDPGSTFKIASALALLEEGNLKLDDSVDINFGRKQFYDRWMEDAHMSAYKKAPFRYVFEHSSNVGIAGLIHEKFKANPQKYIDYLSRLNLDRPIGIEIQEEGNIRIKSPKEKDWSATTLPWMSIGYESRITPLQTLTLYNAIANNGKMVKPYFVSEVRKTNKTLWKHKTEVINEKIASEATVANLRELLQGVVENGTAKNLKNLNYSVAGKTGTAQILMGTKYDKGSHKASFVGYFPADKPKYTCIVIINAPRGGVYYGSLVAGPVFREIADKVYATMWNMHPELETAENVQLPFVKNGIYEDIKVVLNKLGISSYTENRTQTESEWATARTLDKSIKLTPNAINQNLMPDVKGMGLRDALYLLENLDVKVNPQGYGKIRTQSIPPGTPIRSGQTIELNLGS